MTSVLKEGTFDYRLVLFSDTNFVHKVNILY